MIIYIAGPMTGHVNDNREAFNTAATHLSSSGHVVLNPATLPAGMEQAQYMDICLAMVRAAEGVLLLPGWCASAGATVEYHYAYKLGLPTYESRHHIPQAK